MPCQPAFGFRPAACGNTSRSLGWRNVSQLFATAGFKVPVGLLEQLVQLARFGVCFDLAVPLVFAQRDQAVRQFPELVFRKLRNRCLDFLNCTHATIYTPDLNSQLPILNQETMK